MVLLAMLVLSARASPWRVDSASLPNNAGRWVMIAATDCGIDRVLGVSVVIYSRKQGTMAWGHSSLRTVACRDGALRDTEFETYRLSRWNERMFADEHVGEPYVRDDLLRRYRGALVLFRNDDPVDRGWFGDAQAHNREIYELWLDLPQETLEKIVLDAERWYEEQHLTMRAGEPLPERYRPLSTNCTHVLVRLLGAPLAGVLGAGVPPHLPFAWLRLLEDGALLRVLHPSHALVARWGEIPDVVLRRPKPLFRTRSDLPDALTVSTVPLGPWATDPSRSASAIGP